MYNNLCWKHKNNFKKNIPLFNYSINLKNIYRKGYSSKGSNRGIGLYNVQQILNEHKYCTLETSYNTGVFIQTLILKREEK